METNRVSDLKPRKTPGLSNFDGWRDVGTTGPGKAGGDTAGRRSRLGNCEITEAGLVQPQPFFRNQTAFPSQQPAKLIRPPGGKISSRRDSAKLKAKRFVGFINHLNSGTVLTANSLHAEALFSVDTACHFYSTSSLCHEGTGDNRSFRRKS